MAATLEEEVEARYGGQYLVNLTNPYDPSAVAVDATRLSLAVTDVKADFLNVGLVYDNQNQQHVTVALAGVIATLKLRTGLKNDKHSDYLKRLEMATRVLNRDRIMPDTDSELTPSEEVAPGQVRRPAFDEENLAPLIPYPPYGGDDRSRSFEV